MKFKQYKIRHFKMYDSLAFCTFSVLCICYLCLVPNYFITVIQSPAPTKKPLPSLACSSRHLLTA